MNCRPAAASSALPSLLAALAVGALVAWVDFHTDEPTVPVAFLLAGSFCVGFANPRKAWRGALPMGLALFVAHAFSRLIGYTPPSGHPQPNVFVVLIALLPAFLGTYAGALSRMALRGTPPPPSSSNAVG